MNETITYEWSEPLANEAMRAYFKTVTGTSCSFRKLGVLLIIIGCVIAVLDRDLWVFPVVIFSFGALLFAVYAKLNKQIKDSGQLLTDPTINVTITDASIDIISSTATRTIQWGKLTKVKTADSFLLLFCGNLLVGSFPLASFSQMQIDYIKSKVGNNPAPQTARKSKKMWLSFPLLIIALIALAISTAGSFKATFINDAYHGELKNYSTQEAANLLLDLLENDEDLSGYKIAFTNPNDKKVAFKFSDLKSKEDLIEIFRNKMGASVTDNTENRFLILEN